MCLIYMTYGLTIQWRIEGEREQDIAPLPRPQHLDKH